MNLTKKQQEKALEAATETGMEDGGADMLQGPHIGAVTITWLNNFAAHFLSKLAEGQEPVAYVDQHYGIMRTGAGIDLPAGAKLYAAPVIQTEQEPKAWAMPGSEPNLKGWIDCKAWCEGEFTMPLYAAPQPCPSCEAKQAKIDAAETHRLTAERDALKAERDQAWDDGHIAGRQKSPTFKENQDLRNERDALAAQNEQMRETFAGIAKSNWRKWEELASLEEFERWAKSRANHMLALPDLAADVLKRRDAALLRKIADENNPVPASELRRVADAIEKGTK